MEKSVETVLIPKTPGWNDPPVLNSLLKQKKQEKIEEESEKLVDLPNPVDILGKLKSLQVQCLEESNTIAMKKRIQDADAKLQLLYSKLEENSLSKGTMLGLENIISEINNKNFDNALELHRNLVSSGSLSELSAFIPAVKILIQSLSQIYNVEH